MKYLKLFENDINLSPLYIFKMEDVIEYFNDANEILKFLRTTLIGNRLKVKFITPMVRVKTINYTNQEAAIEAQFYQFKICGINMIDNKKIFPYLNPTGTVQVYDEIPEESKKVLLKIKKMNTQKRFDL